jgi:hypothetical protein
VNIGRNVTLTLHGLLVPQSNIVPLSVALVGDWIVGTISGNTIGIVVPVEILDHERDVILHVSEISDMIETRLDPEAVGGVATMDETLWVTFLYSSKLCVKRKSVGICHPIERNPRSDDDLSLRSLVVVLLILRIDFSWSHSRR